MNKPLWVVLFILSRKFPTSFAVLFIFISCPLLQEASHMNQPNSPTDWEKRLQELEAEVNASSQQQDQTTQQDSVSPSSPVGSESGQFSRRVQGIALQVRRWFDQLPILGKVIVGAVAVGISLSLLKTVFQLITSVLTLAIIGALGYVAYQVFIGSKNNTE
jgi:hypothetical protein